MNGKVTLGVLLALILGHIVLAASFAAETPYRTSGIMLGQRGPNGGPDFEPDIGAPDERQHVNYVIHLAEGQGLPIFDPKSPDLNETLENHQPPLYYVLGVCWTKMLGATDLTSQDGGLKLRSLNVVIGAITVSGVFFLLLWGFESEGLALVGTAFAALLPMFAAMSGAVSNDPLLFCVCTWTLALLTLAVKSGWTWRLSLGIGVLIGLSLLTKTSALALAPVLLIAILQKSAKKPSIAMSAAAAALAFCIVAPWWTRNQNLYHDPLAIQAFSQAFTHTAQKEGMLNMIRATQPDVNPQIAYWKDWVGWWTARSFFGVFGYMDIWLNERGVFATGPGSPNTLYRLLLAASFLCGVGWLAAFRDAGTKQRALAHVVNGSFFLITLILFLRFNTQYFQAQARYLFPAIGAIAGAFALGLQTLCQRRSALALGLMVVVLASLDAYALWRLPQEFTKRTGSFAPAAQIESSGGDVYR